jgi:hypothetical protein
MSPSTKMSGTPTRAHPRGEDSISNGFSMGLSPEGLIVVGTRTDTRNDGSGQGRLRRLRASLIGRPNRRKASRLPATRTLRRPVFDCPDRIGEDQKSEDASQRGRKHGPSQRLGFYRPAWRGEPPGIYLVVDNILGQERPWLQFARDFTIAEVLFHEVGHHLGHRRSVAPSSSGRYRLRQVRSKAARQLIRR